MPRKKPALPPQGCRAAPIWLQKAAERLLGRSPLKNWQEFLNCLHQIEDFELLSDRYRPKSFACVDGNKDADDEETVLYHVCKMLCRDPPASQARFLEVFGFELGFKMYTVTECMFPQLVVELCDDAHISIHRSRERENEDEPPEHAGGTGADEMNSPFAIKLKTALDAAKSGQLIKGK